jgi:hypothetical protein
MQVLTYAAGQTPHSSGERIRVDRFGDELKVIVFPRGVRSFDGVMVFIALPVFMLAFGAAILRLLYVLTFTAPSVRMACFAMLGLGMFVAYVLVFIADFDCLRRQSEFNAGPDGLVLVSVGPRGLRQRRWSADQISDLCIVRGRRHSPRRLTLVDHSGKHLELLRQLPGDGDLLEQAATQLRRALSLTSPAVSSG